MSDNNHKLGSVLVSAFFMALFFVLVYFIGSLFFGSFMSLFGLSIWLSFKQWLFVFGIFYVICFFICGAEQK